MNALYILDPSALERIYPAAVRQELASRATVAAPPQTKATIAENPALLAEVEAIFSGWGGPRIDADFLAAAPKLRIVFYGAGSVRGIVSDPFWERGGRICSAWGANAVAVAEYTLSQLLFCLKLGWRQAREVREQRRFVRLGPVPGAYGSTVGLVSLGMIGRRVARLLQGFDVKVIAYDPYVAPPVAADLKVELVGLDELFRRADAVSLHTPWLEETVGMITGAHFAAMKENASFINTARGAVVREPEMIDVLRRRPDLQAVLDVTYPEPPTPDSPLYTLPNVVLTPHIAGVMDGECERMGRYMVDELDRYLAGEPLQWELSRAQAAIMA